MITVDYSYYKDTFGGKAVLEEDFNGVSRKAQYILSYLTYGRTDNLLEDACPSVATRVKDCLCALCDSVNANTDSDGALSDKLVSSQSIGSKSISYVVASSSKSSMTSYSGIVDMYLSGTYLLCAWV